MYLGNQNPTWGRQRLMHSGNGLSYQGRDEQDRLSTGEVEAVDSIQQKHCWKVRKRNAHQAQTQTTSQTGADDWLVTGTRMSHRCGEIDTMSVLLVILIWTPNMAL